MAHNLASAGQMLRRRLLLGAPALIGALLLTLSGVARADPFAFPRYKTFGTPEWHRTAVALGDVDNDGDLDLVVGSGELALTDRIKPGYIYLNDGAGDFHVGPVVCGATPDVLCFGSSTASISGLALGDFDQDGYLDIAAGYNGAPAAIFPNDPAPGGARVFGPGVSVGPPGVNKTILASADLDGRNGPDLIVGVSDGQNMVFLNDGAGSFPTGTLFGTGGDRTESLAVGDLDGANGPDIIAGNNGEQSVLYLNDGAGHFAAGVIVCGVTAATRCVGGPTDATTGVALGRLDGDAALDLIVTRSGASNQRYLNDGAGNFGSAAAFGDANGTTVTLATGDFDRDGDLDLATGEEGRANQLYVNDGDGTLSLLATVGNTATPRAMRAGDLDGDGDLDLVLSNGGLPGEVYLNGGAGSFAEATARAFDGPASRVATGDLDNDGNLDIVTLGVQQPRLTLLDAHGEPTTSSPLGEPGSVYKDLALGDLDGDGDLDIALGGLGQGVVLFNQGVGSGIFFSGNVTCFPSPEVACFGSRNDKTHSVALADIDGDGPLDIVAGNSDAGPPIIYLNQGSTFLNRQARCDGSETPRVICLGRGGERTRSVASGDLDGDGDPDVVVGSDGSPNQIYLNNGNGTFTAGATIGSGADKTRALALGDLNGDGRLDIAIGNYQDQSLILFNQGGARFATGLALCRLEAEVSCFGSGLDLIQSLAVADMDNDGDLDLLVGQGREPGFTAEGQSTIYINDGAGKLVAQRSFGASTAQTFSLATGDLDHDGDQDLVVARADLPSLIYRNAQAGGDLQSFAAPRLSVLTPGPAARPGGVASATILDTPVISIGYRLSSPTAIVTGSYSLDGGGRWLPAVPASGLTQAPGPDGSLIYAWDTFASGFFGRSDTVVFRLVASSAAPRFPGAEAGSYQHAYVAAQTSPFRARGTQVRVVQEGGAPLPQQATATPTGKNRLWLPLVASYATNRPARVQRGALVYRWRDDQVEAQPIAAEPGNAAQTAYRADGQGYLQGRGTLQLGDHLVALQPIAATQTYTLYFTSGAPTTTGISSPVTGASGRQSAAVSETGVQTLTVSPSNPLILFNLKVSLEWDARNDPQYVQRLSADLRRSSAILYDWADGQVALGDVTIYHDRQEWDNADIRIYASNRLRPHANQGGIVVVDEADPTVQGVVYQPGSVSMGAVWNRYGESESTVGEDWPRTLAHELGHYLLFLNEDYLSLENGVLSPVDSCPSAMSDPYLDDTSELHPRSGWLPACAQTLSNLTAQRSDWETIKAFYDRPELSFRLSEPVAYNANPGPAQLVLAVTRIREVAPAAAPTTLSAPIFYLTNTSGQSLITSPRARAILYQSDAAGARLVDLGSPVDGQVEARGARAGADPRARDELCVYDPADQLVGCQFLQANSQRLALRTLPAPGEPEVAIDPLNPQLIEVTVARAQPGRRLQAQLFPAGDLAPAAITLSEISPGVYHGRFPTLSEAAIEGHVRIWAEGEPGQRWETVSTFAVGGDPGRARQRRPSRPRARRGPGVSPLGQAHGYGDDRVPAGEFYTLQSTAAIVPPAWATVVGQAYRLTATAGAPQLAGDASISIGYLSGDVEPGEEPWVRVYFWEDGRRDPRARCDSLPAPCWRQLSTTLNAEHNTAAAPTQGPGLYALFSSIELPLRAGWNQIAYPVATRTVKDALRSIEGRYTTVYGFDPDSPHDPWLIYDVSQPDELNTLEKLELGKGYLIYVTQDATLRLRGPLGKESAPGMATAALARPATPWEIDRTHQLYLPH